MSAIEHAENMLVLAHHDIQALKGMLDEETFTDGIFGFHAQQAVEKSLKAWITAIGGSYPFVHDIGELIEVLKDRNCLVEGLEEYIDYNPFAVQIAQALPGRANSLSTSAAAPSLSDSSILCSS